MVELVRPPFPNASSPEQVAANRKVQIAGIAYSFDQLVPDALLKDILKVKTADFERILRKQAAKFVDELGESPSEELVTKLTNTEMGYGTLGAIESERTGMVNPYELSNIASDVATYARDFVQQKLAGPNYPV